jgi:PAS domain S-box-containing protein
MLISAGQSDDAQEVARLRARINALESELDRLRTSSSAAFDQSVNQTLLGAVLQYLPVGVGVLDETGRFLLRNPAMSRYVSGDHIPSLAPEDDRWFAKGEDGARLPHALYPGARALRGETVLPGIEFLFADADGQEIWTRVSAIPLESTGPFGRGAVVVIEDIDRVKRAGIELGSRLDELNALYDTSPAGLCVLDRDLRFVRINKRLAEINGVTAESHIGRSVEEVIPSIAQQAVPALRRVLETGEPVFDIEISGETAAQPGVRRFWIESWVPLRDEHGGIAGINIVAKETTEERRGAEALQEAQEAAERLAAERTAILGQLFEGVIVTDREGRITFLNRAAAALHRTERLGIGPDGYSDAYGLFTEDGRPYPADELPLARAVKGEVVENARWRIRRPDGSEVLAMGSARPVYAADGSPLGAVLTLRNDTERRAAEEALALSQRRLKAVLDNTTMAVFMMDERQHCSFMNAAAELLTGYRFEETQGRPLHDVIHHTYPDGRHFPLHECAIDRAFPEDNRMAGEEIFVHKDGHFYPVAYMASPIRDEAAKAVGTIIEVRNIEAEKEQQARMRMLIDELNHRVKNTLATVQSIVAQATRGEDVPPRVRKSIEGRLIALSGSHSLLTREEWTGAGLGDVVVEALKPFGLGQFDIKGENVRLTPKASLALGMAIHELATNAVKYGALSNDKGGIKLHWHAGPDGRLQFRWEESGGPPVVPPSRTGFGSRLIARGLAHELDGSVRLEYPREGLTCEIDMPLPNAGGGDVTKKNFRYQVWLRG